MSDVIKNEEIKNSENKQNIFSLMPNDTKRKPPIKPLIEGGIKSINGTKNDSGSR